MSERTTYLMKQWRDRALAAEAELAALRDERKADDVHGCLPPDDRTPDGVWQCPDCDQVFVWPPQWRRQGTALALPYADHPDYREGWRP